MITVVISYMLTSVVVLQQQCLQLLQLLTCQLYSCHHAPYMQEEASTVAITLCADTASTSRGYAMRANARWCQGNLLGAYEDLHTAWEAMQTVDVNYATNMSEVCILLTCIHCLMLQNSRPVLSSQPIELHHAADSRQQRVSKSTSDAS